MAGERQTAFQEITRFLDNRRDIAENETNQTARRCRR